MTNFYTFYTSIQQLLRFNC